jgi:hypothetical protein
VIKDEQLSDEAVEAAARAIIIANGGDPDALLRLTIHKTTIKAWQQVVPLARAALTAGLSAWPGVGLQTSGRITGSSSEGEDLYALDRLILPLSHEDNDD